MRRRILTLTAVLIVIIGGILLIKSVMPNYLWVNVYKCNQTSVMVILRNDFPGPVEIKSITLFLYDKNGDLVGIKRVNVNNERLPTGFTFQTTINLNDIPVGEVVNIVARVDYEFLIVQGSVSVSYAPICPK